MPESSISPTQSIEATEIPITPIEPEGESKVIATATNVTVSDNRMNESQLSVSPEVEAIAVPLPTATQAPISIPPFQPLQVSSLPTTIHDLVYVSNQSLNLWTAHDQQVRAIFKAEKTDARFPSGTFAEIGHLSVSADGNRAAVVVRYVQPNQQEGDGSGDTESINYAGGEVESDIVFIDLVSKETWSVVEGIKAEVDRLSLSPDQTRIVFRTSSIDEPNDVSRLFTISTPSSSKQIQLSQIGECDKGCNSLTWRDDSDLFAFGNEQGAYISGRDSVRPQLILESRDNTEENPIDLTWYEPISWAPNGRSILLNKIDQLALQTTHAVFDLPTNHIFPMPTAEIGTLYNTNWLDDSRLISALPFSEAETRLITFRLDFDHLELRQDEVFDMSIDGEVSGLSQSADNQFVFGLQHDDPSQAGLYRLTSFSQAPLRANGVPSVPAAPAILWSDDGSEAILNFGNQKFIATADGNLFAFQEHIWDLHWLPKGDSLR